MVSGSWLGLGCYRYPVSGDECIALSFCPVRLGADGEVREHTVVWFEAELQEAGGHAGVETSLILALALELIFLDFDLGFACVGCV